ncbi:MAG: hypothetical protein OEV49_12635 [candidate division Zixibacteria bacterium]|nr:hypothetical protein [candidate division Zixibacteria bacterium]MDH3936982.1 hypothetical protein [candidate division Zixibacteria bacterium]MDH4035595.1 hypothetical protein [candidate division Zixibacteria bacterium]
MTTECTSRFARVDQVDKTTDTDRRVPGLREIRDLNPSHSTQAKNDLPALPSWLDPVSNLKSALR